MLRRLNKVDSVSLSRVLFIKESAMLSSRFSHYFIALLFPKITVALSAWGSSFNWKNEFEELDLSHTTSECAPFSCKCVHVWMCVHAAVRFCFSLSQWICFEVVGCGPADMWWGVFCMWVEKVWHSFLIALSLIFLSPIFHVNKQARFTGWWHRSLRAEKRTAWSSDLLRLFVCVWTPLIHSV